MYKSEGCKFLIDNIIYNLHNDDITVSLYKIDTDNNEHYIILNREIINGETFLLLREYLLTNDIGSLVLPRFSDSLNYRDSKHIIINSLNDNNNNYNIVSYYIPEYLLENFLYELCIDNFDLKYPKFEHINNYVHNYTKIRNSVPLNAINSINLNYINSDQDQFDDESEDYFDELNDEISSDVSDYYNSDHNSSFD